MNLPSSLALPQSKLLQGRTLVLLLILAAVLIGAGVYVFLAHPLAPSKLPTVATSPDAIATPRPVAKAPVKPLVVYGPPAPAWVERVAMPAPSASTAPVVYGPFTPQYPAPPALVATAPVVPAPAPVASATSMTPGSAAITTAPVAPGGAAIATAPAVPGAATAAAPGAAVTKAPAIPGSATAAPNAGTLGLAGESAEAPKSIDASVLFAREQYTYSSSDRRDPFQSLLDGRFQSQAGDNLIDVGDMHLVGIMWGSTDKFALVEDSRGRGFVLRVGDPVVNGYISGITKTEIQIVQNAFGDSQTLAIQLQPKEGDKNATRK